MDKYDEEIEKLVELEAADVKISWSYGDLLFQFCTPSGNSQVIPGKKRAYCGCLTQVKGGAKFDDVAWTDALTEAIRADPTVPLSIMEVSHNWDALPDDEKRARLEPFARWQRRLDAEIRKTV